MTLRRIAAAALALVFALGLAAPALADAKPVPAAKVNINQATVQQLATLPGVGEKRARDIVALRSKSPFRKPEDVLTVKGLGPKWYARVKGLVTVGATAPVAQAGAAQLAEFSGAGRS